MIIDEIEEYWIWILPATEQKKPKEWEEHGGKWLIFKEYEQLEILARKIDQFVENGQIALAKFSREPLFYDTPVMCVYCLDSNKEKVWSILEKLGIQKRIWKYDKQTTEDYKPGGRLYQKYQEFHRG